MQVLQIARTLGVRGRSWGFDGRLELACLIFAFLRTGPWCVALPLLDQLILDHAATPTQSLGLLLGAVAVAALATLQFVGEHDNLAYNAHLRNFARRPPRLGIAYIAPAEYRAAVCDVVASGLVALLIQPRMVLITATTLAAFVAGLFAKLPTAKDALHVLHGVVAAHMVLLICGAFWGMPAGTFTVGQLIACLGLLHTVFSNVTRLALQQGAWRRPPTSATPRVRELVQDGGHVFLHDIQVTWPGATHPTLRRLSWELPPRSSVAIVGASGAGKTTLARLLCGEIAPNHGDGTVDGLDLRHLQASGYVAYVGRTPWLVTGSVADNLTMAQSDDDDLHDALIDAGFDDEELPDGTQTPLINFAYSASRSVALRINIARAVLCRPRLLILDQTLDVLDPFVAQRLMHGLQRMSCTVLVLTLHPAVARLARFQGALSRGQLVWDH